MGASYAKFKEVEVGAGNVTGNLGKCISPTCVSKAAMKLTITADPWSKTASVVDDATGAKLMSTKASTGFNSITVTVTDGSGAEICTAVGKKGLTSASFQIFKASPTFEGQAKQKEGYVFSKGTMKLGMGTAACEYSLIKAGDDEAIAVPLYNIDKIGRMGLVLTFTNQEETLVAKYACPSSMNQKINVAEIGPGVDYAAVCLIAGLVGAATGSGGATVGALVGAGVI